MKGNAIITQEAMDMYDHALGLLDTSIKELGMLLIILCLRHFSGIGLRQTLSDFCEGVGNQVLKSKFCLLWSGKDDMTRNLKLLPIV